MLLRDMLKLEKPAPAPVKKVVPLVNKTDDLSEEKSDPGLLDADQRYKIRMERLKTANPKLYKKIIGMD